MKSHDEEATINLTIFLSWPSAELWDHSVKTKPTKPRNYPGLNDSIEKLLGSKQSLQKGPLLFVSGEKSVSVGRQLPLPERPEDGDGGGRCLPGTSANGMQRSCTYKA